MNRFKSFFIDCTEANRCCDKAQYNEASFTEKIKIHLHNIFCRPCKKYTDNNKKLSELVRKANLKTCTKEEKRAWKAKIESEATK